MEALTQTLDGDWTIGEARAARVRAAVMAGYYALLFALVLLPVLSVRLPLMADTLNHLARIHILLVLDHSPWLQRYYEPTPGVVPYFGMDVVVRALLPFMSLEQAGWVFTALCVVMPPVAALALQTAAWRRVGLAPAGAFLMCYNRLLYCGFLNYLFSAGCALLLFAAWVATEKREGWVRPVVFAPFVIALFLCHPFACAAYLLLVGGHTLGFAALGWRRFLLAGLRAAVPVVPVLLVAAWLGSHAAASTPGRTIYGDWHEKLAALLSIFYFPQTDITVWALLLCLAAGLIVWRTNKSFFGSFFSKKEQTLASARPGRPVPFFAPNLTGGLIVLACAAAATPVVLFSVWGADFRLPLVVACVALAAINPRRGFGVITGPALVATLLALVAIDVTRARSALVTLEHQLDRLRPVVDALPAGARTLVLDMPESCGTLRVVPRDMTENFSMLAVLERDAFVPLVFVGYTQLSLKPEWRIYGWPSARPVTMAQLADGAAHGDPPGGPPPYGPGGRVYWLGWPKKFDYLLVTSFGCKDFAPPPGLTFVKGNEIGSVWRIAPIAR